MIGKDILNELNNSNTVKEKLDQISKESKLKQNYIELIRYNVPEIDNMDREEATITIDDLKNKETLIDDDLASELKPYLSEFINNLDYYDKKDYLDYIFSFNESVGYIVTNDYDCVTTTLIFVTNIVLQDIIDSL